MQVNFSLIWMLPGHQLSALNLKKNKENQIRFTENYTEPEC